MFTECVTDDRRTSEKAATALSVPMAIGTGVAFLVGGWLIYDGLCRTPLSRHGGVLAAAQVQAFVAGLVDGGWSEGQARHVQRPGCRGRSPEWGILFQNSCP